MTTAKEIRDVASELLTGVARVQNALKSQDGFAVWVACSMVFEALSVAFPPSLLDVKDERSAEVLQALRRAIKDSVAIDEKASKGTLLC